MDDAAKKKRIIIFVISFMLTVSAIVSAVNLMNYNQRRKEAIRLALKREELEYRVDELKHRLDSPIDDAYIEKVAREKLGLYFPDEIIYFNDIKD